MWPAGKEISTTRCGSWPSHWFGNRFGLVHVDFKTQKRTPKMSAAANSSITGQLPKAPVQGSASSPETLISDWFGEGPDFRDAGFDFRVEWSQF